MTNFCLVVACRKKEKKVWIVGEWFFLRRIPTLRNLKIRKDQSKVSNKIRKQTRRNMAKRFACFETRAMMVRPICPLNIQKRDFVLCRLLLANHELLGGWLGKGEREEAFWLASPPSLPAARMET